MRVVSKLFPIDVIRFGNCFRITVHEYYYRY
jgi:hypothetical protein